jgi:hypothetical protein
MSSDTFWRHLLEPFFGGHPRLMAAFEDMGQRNEIVSKLASDTAEATDALQDATVVVLSLNGAFTNERVLRRGPGVRMVDTGTALIIEADPPLKELADPAALGNYVDDAAAAAGGVEVGHFYRNGSVVMVRIA